MATAKKLDPQHLPDPPAGGRYIRKADGSLEQVAGTDEQRSRFSERNPQADEPTPVIAAPAAPAPAAKKE